MDSELFSKDAWKAEIAAASADVLALSILTAAALSYASAVQLTHSGTSLFIDGIASAGIRDWLQPALWSFALIAFVARRSHLTALFIAIGTVFAVIDFIRGWSWDATLSTASSVLGLELFTLYTSIALVRSGFCAFSRKKCASYLGTSVATIALFALSGLAMGRTDLHSWWHKWLADFTSVWLWYRSLLPAVALLLIRRHPRLILAVGLMFLSIMGGDSVYSVIHYTKVSWANLVHPSAAWQLVVSEVSVVANYLALPIALIVCGLLATRASPME